MENTSLFLCYDDDQFRAMVMDLARRRRISKRIGNVALLKNSPVVLVGRFGIGAPAVVAQCEELIACGTRRIISLGTAASMTGEIGVGDVVVCEKAFSEEGTSGHYVPGREVFGATQHLADEIYAHLNKQGVRCKMGSAWTTDAPYRETARKRNAFLAKDASVVEMEASALYMLATYRKVEALSVFVVGDSIAGSTWEPHFKDKQVRMQLKIIGQRLLDFLISKPLSPLS